MRTATLSHWWIWAMMVALLTPTAAIAGQRYHARFAPQPEGPVLIFSDDFESGGTCDWFSTTPCTLYILTIPDNAGGGDHGFPTVIQLQVGATLHIVNGDVTPHRIHANNHIGLLHQESEMGQGEEYVGTISQSGQDTLYCHSHGTASGELLVIVP